MTPTGLSPTVFVLFICFLIIGCRDERSNENNDAASHLDTDSLSLYQPTLELVEVKEAEISNRIAFLSDVVDPDAFLYIAGGLPIRMQDAGYDSLDIEMLIDKIDSVILHHPCRPDLSVEAQLSVAQYTGRTVRASETLLRLKDCMNTMRAIPKLPPKVLGAYALDMADIILYDIVEADSADVYLQLALQIFSTDTLNPFLYRTYFYLAQQSRIKDDFQKGISFIERAHELIRLESPIDTNWFLPIANLASALYYDSEIPVNADQIMTEAIVMLKANLPEKINRYLLFCANYAVILQRQSRFAESIHFLDQASAVASNYQTLFKNGSYEQYRLGDLHRCYGYTYRYADSFDKSIKHFNLAITLLEKSRSHDDDYVYSDAIRGLADVLFEDGQFELSAIYARKALSVSLGSDRMPLTTRNLKSAYDSEYFLDSYCLALHQISVRTGNIGLLSKVVDYYIIIDSLFGVLRDFGHDEDALVLLKLQHTVYGNALSAAFDLWTATHDRQYLELGYQFAMHSKAFLIDQAMVVKRISDIPQELVFAENQLKTQMTLDRLDGHIPSPSDQFKLDSIQNILRMLLNAHSSDHVIEANTISQHLTRTSETLLEFHADTGRIFSFVFTSDSVYWNRIVQADTVRQLHTLANYLWSQEGVRESPIFYQQHASYLWQVLTGGHLSLDSSYTLHVVPDSWISGIPFSALVTNSLTTIRSYSDLDYICLSAAVEYHHSARSLLSSSNLTARDASTVGIFSFTDEKEIKNRHYQSPVLGDLVQASREADFLLRHFHSKKVSLRKGTDFTSDSYRLLTSCDIVHIASHVIPSNKHWLTSWIAIRQPDGPIDSLTAAQILNMPFNNTLIFLNTCGSGAGLYSEGEGTFSLARAFAIAGSRNIIQTQWPVVDALSGSITTAFYQQFEQGHDAGASLRIAQSAYLSQATNTFAHPYYWAQYRLVRN